MVTDTIQKLSPEIESSPRVYRVGRFTSIFVTLVAIFMIIGPPVLIIDNVILARSHLLHPLILYICGVGDMIGGIYLIAYVIKNKIVLYLGAIESVGIFKTCRIERADIGAKRVLPLPATTYVLYPVKREMRKMFVEVTFPLDDFFRQWMSGIPDVNRDFLHNRKRAK
jgi:hypothetical protein